jgi:hypothetical protein
VKTTSYETIVMFVVQPPDICSFVGYPVLRYAAVFVGLEVSAALKNRVGNWVRRPCA